MIDRFQDDRVPCDAGEASLFRSKFRELWERSQEGRESQSSSERDGPPHYCAVAAEGVGI